MSATSGPVVYVDTSDVREGRVDELRAALDELTQFVEREEPQLVSYAVYFGADDTRMTVVHVHADADSLRFHMDEAGPLFGRFAALIRLRSIDVYGAVGPDIVERLEQKAEMLGGAVVRLHDLGTGFVRSP